jgi:Ca-activated chloride channel family protein
MKIIFFAFSSFIFVNSVFAQAWVDSLEVARKAYKSGDYDKAVRYYQSAHKQAPKDVDLSDEIAQSTYRARDFKNAQKAYEQSANDKKSPEERARVNHNLGNARMKQKDYDGAISAYKESLRNNPNDPETKYNLSEAIRQKKQQDQKQNQDQKDNQCKNPNQNQNNNQNNSNNSNQKPSDQRNNGSDNKKMPNKQADKMLDDLTRKEAETKKRLAKNSNDKKPGSNSGKDW